MRFTHKQLSADKLSVRFGLTTMDQSVSSISNFAVGVAVARVAGVAGLGAYSLVYAVWLVVAGIHRSLITDPMSIENDMYQSDASRHVRIGLSAELWLGIGAATLFCACGAILIELGQHVIGLCFLAISPTLPCLLAQDYWRWVGFMKAQPQKSLTNDIVFDLLQGATFAALFLFGIRSPLMAIGAWGVGAAGGALLGLWQFSSRPTLIGGLDRIQTRWKLSKWLVAVSATSQATSQATLVLSAAFLGPAGIGGLKAATSLVSGPSMVLIQAGGNIGLPEATKALKERGWPGLRRIQHFITAAGMVSVGLVATVVFCFGHQLLVLVYGSAFGRFTTVAEIMAIAYFINTVGLGAILSLKAIRKIQLLLRMTVISLIVSIVALCILAPIFGIVGAAVSTLIGTVTNTIGRLIIHWRNSRKEAERIAAVHSMHRSPAVAGIDLPSPVPSAPEV